MAIKNVTVGLHTCNLSARFRTGVNPFTHAEVRFPLDDGLTQAERDRVIALLTEMRASAADPDGYQKIHCADGGKFGISAGGLDSGLAFKSFDIEIDVLTSDVVTGIFRLAIAGNMAICSSIDPLLAALTSKPQSKLVETRWPAAPIISTPGQLEDWMTNTLFKAS